MVYHVARKCSDKVGAAHKNYLICMKASDNNNDNNGNDNINNNNTNNNINNNMMMMMMTIIVIIITVMSGRIMVDTMIPQKAAQAAKQRKNHQVYSPQVQ